MNEKLLAQAEKIRSSKVLGREGALTRLFEFLFERSLRGVAPEEMEVAVRVFVPFAFAIGVLGVLTARAHAAELALITISVPAGKPMPGISGTIQAWRASATVQRIEEEGVVVVYRRSLHQ
jgi:hypothetical protein